MCPSVGVLACRDNEESIIYFRQRFLVSHRNVIRKRLLLRFAPRNDEKVCAITPIAKLLSGVTAINYP